MTKTPLYLLLETKLGRDPALDMRERRERGETWRSISHAYLQFGIDVTEVTLRAWLKDATAPTAAAQ